MRYHVLATDYDGTLATHGEVDPETITALERCRASGRKLVMVSGRELEDLQKVFSRLDLFDALVLENGAIVYTPTTKEVRLLAEPPPAAFVEALRARGVGPMSVGRVIVATWEPHQNTVLEVIHEMGLELQVIFNKGAVMILPSGINKAVGLAAALEDLGLSPHNAVGVGDAENDHALLALCEAGAAVSNALPTLKDRADIVLSGDHGRGVQQLIAGMIDQDLAGRPIRRHKLPLGTDGTGTELALDAYEKPVLVVGTSGAGKSTLAQAILEQLNAQKYQYCIVDPEGDYTELCGATAIGDATHAPALDEVFELLGKPGENVVVNLIGVSLADRPAFFATFFARFHELRARTGRPHWLLLDEVHHVLPDSYPQTKVGLGYDLPGLVLVTIHPEHTAAPALAPVETVVVIGAAPAKSLADFAAKVGIPAPMVDGAPLPRGEALVWRRGQGQGGASGAEGPTRIKVHAPKQERRRHVRKYAVGELPPDESFYFRGPEGKLKLRAQNLHLFVQVADGVDDDTWVHHLRQGDYSRWFRDHIKDPELADIAANVERQGTLDGAGLGPNDSRARIRAAIEARYTA